MNKTINNLIIWSLFFMSGLVIAQSSQLKEDDKLHEELAYIDAISIYMGLANQGVEDPCRIKNVFIS